MADEHKAAAGTIPADDPNRTLTLSNPDARPHIGVVGDTYTILLSGHETAGKYCLVDMLVPPGGGPGPHRHDFEETFSLLEGELEFTFRGEARTANAGETVHIPANAPHRFQNVSSAPARMLCICAPAGQEEFFRLIGTPVGSRTTPPPPLDKQAEAAFLKKAMELAPEYRTELLPPK